MFINDVFQLGVSLNRPLSQYHLSEDPVLQVIWILLSLTNYHQSVSSSLKTACQEAQLQDGLIVLSSRLAAVSALRRNIHNKLQICTQT